MLDVEKKDERIRHGFHLVIMCDEAGIFNAFNFLKDQLSIRETTFLSLIYYVSYKNPYTLFEKELSILEKRFPYNLIVHILKIGTTKYHFNQELVEATINSNTLPIIKFSVFGNVDFVNHANGVLRFLDIKEFMINSKIM